MTVIELLLSGLMIQNVLYLFRTLHCVYLHKYIIYLAQDMPTLDQGVSCFSEAVACNQAVLGKLETPWALYVN